MKRLIISKQEAREILHAFYVSDCEGQYYPKSVVKKIAILFPELKFELIHNFPELKEYIEKFID